MARSKKGDRKQTKGEAESKAVDPCSKRLPPHDLMKALAHQMRIRILAILIERVASPNEMSKELGEKLSGVSYHVQVLKDYGLIVEDHRAPRRGAVEHFYRAAAPTLIPPRAWDGLPAGLRRGTSARILRKFLDDAWTSMEEKIFDKPPGELSWMPLLLDETGIEELGELVRDFLDSVLVVQAKSGQRLPTKKSERGAEAKSATVFLASFMSARSPADDQKASAATMRR